MKPNKPLLIILALTIITRLIFAFNWHEIWWDSGVYIGMGKYLYSAGESGLWEHIRPPVMPFILGLFWKLGLDPALFGRLFEIILMTGIVWLTYLLSKHWFSNRTALLASLIVSFSPLFYYLSFHQYTEIPSTFLILLSLWLFTKKQHFWTGITVGLAFLTKFPAGMFLAIIGTILVYRKEWKSLLFTVLGFSIATAPYALYNWLAYGSPLATLVAAQDAIQRALGCNVLRQQPWWQYGRWLAFSETPLHLFSLAGAYALYKTWNKKHLLYLLSIIIPVAYFIQLHCRDYRYLALFLPFIAILTALGVVWIYDRLNLNKKHFTALLVVLGILLFYTSITFYYGNETQQSTPAERYYHYFTDKPVNGELWISNPIVAAHTNELANKMYYPIYNEDVSHDFLSYVQKHHNRIGAVMLDNCGGGIICPPGDTACQEHTTTLIETLDTHYTRAFDKQHGRCWYTIWTTSSP